MSLKRWKTCVRIYLSWKESNTFLPTKISGKSMSQSHSRHICIDALQTTKKQLRERLVSMSYFLILLGVRCLVTVYPKPAAATSVSRVELSQSYLPLSDHYQGFQPGSYPHLIPLGWWQFKVVEIIVASVTLLRQTVPANR